MLSWNIAKAWCNNMTCNIAYKDFCLSGSTRPKKKNLKLLEVQKFSFQVDALKRTEMNSPSNCMKIIDLLYNQCYVFQKIIKHVEEYVISPRIRIEISYYAP